MRCTTTALFVCSFAQNWAEECTPECNATNATRDKIAYILEFLLPAQQRNKRQADRRRLARGSPCKADLYRRFSDAKCEMSLNPTLSFPSGGLHYATSDGAQHSCVFSRRWKTAEYMVTPPPPKMIQSPGGCVIETKTGIHKISTRHPAAYRPQISAWRLGPYTQRMAHLERLFFFLRPCLQQKYWYHCIE